MVKNPRKRTKKGTKKKDIVKMCPKCHSTDVSSFFGNPALVTTGLFRNYNKCNHCGHIGMIFPEGLKSSAPKRVKKLEDVKDRNLVDVSHGKFTIGFFRVSGPILLFFYLMWHFSYAQYLRPPLNFFLLIWGIPAALFITFYGYKREFFNRNEFLKTLSGIWMLYSFFVGPLILLIVFGYVYGFETFTQPVSQSFVK